MQEHRKLMYLIHPFFPTLLSLYVNLNYLHWRGSSQYHSVLQHVKGELACTGPLNGMTHLPNKLKASEPWIAFKLLDNHQAQTKMFVGGRIY